MPVRHCCLLALITTPLTIIYSAHQLFHPELKLAREVSGRPMYYTVRMVLHLWPADLAFRSYFFGDWDGIRARFIARSAARVATKRKITGKKSDDGREI